MIADATSRRQFLATASAGALSTISARQRRPNFVILFTDDQRFNTIRALGNREVHTPNMDRLVARGVTFTHTFTQGGLVGAICMPSRAQLMTGRSVFQVHRGIIDRQASPDPALVTFPEQLRASGYTTFATGKWHNGPVLFNRSFSSGGPIFFGGMDNHLGTLVHDYDPTGAYPKTKARNGAKFSSEMFADSAVSFLRSRDTTKPYLLYVAFTSPHDPRMAPAEYTAMYDTGKIALPVNYLPEHPFDNGELKVRDELLAPFPRTREEVQKHIAGYYAMVSEVDAQIGRVIDAVDASPDADNTWIIFAADNGLAVGQHGLLGKQNLYDHSWRVPLVISGPGVPKGHRTHGLCHLMDVCPTILSLADVPVPPGQNARSLRLALTSGRASLRPFVIGAYRDVQRAIRTERWKLILYNVGGRKSTQLFNLQRDPFEQTNLAGEGQHTAIVSELATTLQQALTAAGDTTRLDDEKWTA